MDPQQPQKSKKSLGKTIAIVLGAFIALLLAAIIIIPLVVDVDQYRPQILKVVNEKINGELKLGKLKLSLWGQILVRVDGVELLDVKKQPIVTVKDAYFHLPFISILSGAPTLTFKMEKPTVRVIKEADGNLNLLSIVKKEPHSGETKEEAAGSKTAESAKPTKVELPTLVTLARLGIELNDAHVSYMDMISNMKAETSINFAVRDLSLSRPAQIEIWADLNTKIAGDPKKGSQGIDIKGPFKITGTLNPQFQSGEFQRATTHFDGDFTSTVIEIPGTFKKDSDVEAKFTANIVATPKFVDIQNVLIKFFNAQVTINGKLENTPPTSTTQLKIESNEIQMGPWVKLTPLLKDYELTGSVNFRASASGSSEKLNYAARLEAKGITAKAPNLKAKPVFNGSVDVATDEIRSFGFTMKAPGNDMTISGSMRSFTKPNILVSVSSNGMDLDQLINFPPPTKEKEESKSAGAGSPETGAKKPAEDMDKLLDPIRSNAMLAAAGAELTTNIKFIKAKGMRIDQITSRSTFKNLVAAIDQFSMKMFDGTITAKMLLDMKPTRPSYQFSMGVQGFDIQKAVTSQMDMFKNTVVGILTVQAKGSGASFNPEPAKKNLNLEGNFRVGRATFASIDIGKMVTDAVNSGIDKAASKVSQLKGRKLKGVPGGKMKYEVITSGFKISGGKFSAPDFVAKAEKSSGFDIEGSTDVGLIDYSLNAKWRVKDPFNITGAKDLSVDIASVHVPQILLKDNEPLTLPITVGCKLTAPCYSYEEIPGHFAAVAAQNVAKAATGRAKAEVNKKKQEVVERAKKEGVNKIKDAFKKFKF